MAEYYTSGQTDALLELRSSTGHSHAFSGLTLTAHTHLWSEVISTPTKLAGYGITDVYNTGQTATLIALVQTGATLLSQLRDVTVGVGTGGGMLITGQTLTWYNGYWINSATTINLTLYYTAAQVDTKFYTSAQTIALFSSTGHSHYLTGLTDVNGAPSHGQYLMYSAGTLRMWIPTTPSLGVNYVTKSGDTMTGNIVFNFMSGTTTAGSTGWTLYVDSTGKLIRGSANISDFITGNTELLETLINERFWSGTTFTGSSLSAFTIHEGQRYVDKNYFYQYLNGTLYRTYYSLANHNHDTRYYTKTELLNTGVLDGRYIRSAVTYNLAGLGDVSISAQTLTAATFLNFNNTNQKWENYHLDMNLYSRIATSVSTGRTIIGLSGLCGGNNLNNNVYIMHLTGATPSGVVGTPTTKVISGVAIDSFGHLNSYTTSELSSLFQPLGTMGLDDLSDVVITSLANTDFLVYNSILGYWKNTQLTMSLISDFNDSNYVHKTTDETIAGTKTFSGAAVFNGGISFSANTTITAPYLNVTSRIIYMNYQGGSTTKTNGLGANGKAGLSIDRGNYLPSTIFYDEGTLASTGGTFKVGFGFTGKTIATVQDSQKHNGIAVWNNTYRLFDTLTAFTYNKALNSLNIGQNVDQGYANNITMGSGNTTGSEYNYCFGLFNTNAGSHSISFGEINNSIGYHSITQGIRNYVGATCSGAFGVDHNLIQMASYIGYSYAFGSGHTMDGTGSGSDAQYCGAFGERNTLTGNWSFATGKLNIINDTAVFSAIVGGSGITATERETLYCTNFKQTGTKIGFFNATPVVKAAALTASETQTTGTTGGSEKYMWTATSSPSNNTGFKDADEFNGMTLVIANLQLRLNQLETHLKSYGLLP